MIYSIILKMTDSTRSYSPREHLIFEILALVSPRISIEDFDINCQLAPVDSGKSYYDRIRVAEWLLEQGIIVRDDHSLYIHSKPNLNWLKPALLEGSDLAWNTLAILDPDGKNETKFQSEFLHEIGLSGELKVISELKSHLPAKEIKRIRHVSLSDDSAGYDIVAPSISLTALTLLLEVKTTSKPSKSFDFFISRNEARVASQNSNWRLVAVLKQDESFEILGHIQFKEFADALPQDTSPLGRWQSAKISVSMNQISGELP
jgi:hypothetical protein